MNTPFKMYGKSPMMKALVGKQGNLPQELKAKILASPATMKKSPAKLDGQAKKGKKGKKDTRTTSQKAAEKRDLDRQIRIYNAREKNRKYHAKREKRELKEKGYYRDVTDGKKYEHAEEMRGTGKNRKMTKFVREKK